MNLNEKIKKEIAELITGLTGVTYKVSDISVPSKSELGDFSAPLFIIAKELKRNPNELALELVQNIKSQSFVEVRAVGGYLNFFLNTSIVTPIVLKELLKNKFVLQNDLKGKKVMIEYLSPNTNKPLTVGHLRNLVLGSTVSNLYKKSKAKVVDAILFNDRGIAISKSMVAYSLYGKGKTPRSENKKPDQFVGDYYVKYGKELENDPKLEEMAKEYLILWEKDDLNIKSLWKKMNGWVYKGYEETLKKLNANNFDKVYYESDFYNKAKEIVLKNIGNGVIKKGKEGEVFADLESEGVPNKILLRSDGTSLYVTQDLYLAKLKDELKLDKSIYVIGNEQDLQMKQLFSILNSLNSSTDKYFHLSYGMMRLPEGKIKSREGFGRALADGLIDELEALAKVEIAKRQEHLSDREVGKIANQVMNGALKFYILNVDPKKEMIFDPSVAIAFTGKTGPYLQYTAVRLNSILRKEKLSKKIDYELLNLDSEKQIVNLLKNYFEILQKSLNNFNPSELTHYLYELAQTVNSYYHEVSVLNEKQNLVQARLALITAVVNVITDGLEVCGIEVPEQM